MCYSLYGWYSSIKEQEYHKLADVSGVRQKIYDENASTSEDLKNTGLLTRQCLPVCLGL
jgi:hypothetical protein